MKLRAYIAVLHAALFAILLAVSPAGSGSMMLLGVGKPAAGGGGGGCAEATAFLARNGNAHPTETTTLICGLVTDGDWSQLDVLYIFATDTSAHALLNLKSSSFTATAVGTVSFSADHGYTGDASTFYLDSNFNPNTVGGNYANASSSLGIYTLNSRTTGQTWRGIAANSSGATIFHGLVPKFTDTFAYAQFSGNASTNPTAMTNAQGLTVGIRTSATAMALWKNGVSLTSNSAATLAVPAVTFIILGLNDNGVPTNLSSDQTSAAFIGGGGINVANVSSRINAYMTSLSINVY